MSKTVTIPNNSKPYFEVYLNGVKYCFPAGVTMEVPDEIASLVECNDMLNVKERELPGKIGDVLTRTAKGYAPEPVPVELPNITASASGKYLKIRVIDGVASLVWASVPTYSLPSASASAIGGVKLGTAVADATDATDVITQFNALVASLVASGALAEYVAPSAGDGE